MRTFEMTSPQSDDLNAIGVLKRREIEARILAPFIEALGDKFDRQAVLDVLRDTVIRVARQQGSELARNAGSPDLDSFAGTLPAWTKDGALEIEVLEKSPQRFAFNVTRCRYAEMYRELGIPELGALLSCNRDFSLIQGFNSEVELTRSRTIMQGDPYCDFRYTLEHNTDPER